MTAERRRMSRSRILKGASDILDKGVYGDLTVDALARSLHMSKSTLYKYFASKEDVIIALVDDACAETEAEFTTSGAFTTTTPAKAVESILDRYAAHAERLPRAAVLQYRRLPAACQDRLELTRNTAGKVLRDVIERGQRAGDFKESDAALASHAIMAAAHAATQAAARGELKGDRGQSVRALYPFFMPGLAAR
jgi:AcrR family transcriptional regulator